MSGMLIPVENSYFAIYTLENPNLGQSLSGGIGTFAGRGQNWDLHATATDRAMAISHARMLVMQPGVCEVHVKKVTENSANGIVRVRDVTRCKKGNFLETVRLRLLAFSAGFLTVSCLALFVF